jgi:hypothetical protein
MKKFSFISIWEKIREGIKRFPLAVFFCAALAVCLILLMENGKMFKSDALRFFFVYYTATAAFLAIVLKLLSEELASKWANLAVQVGGQLVWLGVCVALSLCYKELLGFALEAISLALFIFISAFLVSFFRQKYDIQLWNFGIKSLLYAIISIIIGGVLTGGVDLLIESLKELFKVEVSVRAYGYSAIIIMCFVAPLLFMQMIPSGDAKHDSRTDNPGKLGKGVIHYLFMPLLAAYLVTLYVYALKIVFTWQLPNGWISWLVSVSMLCMVIILILIYPLQFNEGNKFDKAVSKYLPGVMLPLLILMTVAIGRRLNDYGITISRLYLLTFNLWCYAVCIVLILNKKKRFWWIPASFAAIFLLTSIGPWSYNNIVKRSFRTYVKESLLQPQVKKALSSDPISFAKADSAAVMSVIDKTKYLDGNYDKTATSDLADSLTIKRMLNYTSRYADDAQYYSMQANSSTAAIAGGYSRMAIIDTTFTMKSLPKDSLKVSLQYMDSGKKASLPVVFPLKKMISISNSSSNELLPIQIGESCLFLKSFHIDYSVYESSLSIEGILLLK